MSASAHSRVWLEADVGGHSFELGYWPCVQNLHIAASGLCRGFASVLRTHAVQAIVDQERLVAVHAQYDAVRTHNASESND